jgi:hypothetical protein
MFCMVSRGGAGRQRLRHGDVAAMRHMDRDRHAGRHVMVEQIATGSASDVRKWLMRVSEFVVPEEGHRGACGQQLHRVMAPKPKFFTASKA